MGKAWDMGWEPVDGPLADVELPADMLKRIAGLRDVTVDLQGTFDPDVVSNMLPDGTREMTVSITLDKEALTTEYGERSETGSVLVYRDREHAAEVAGALGGRLLRRRVLVVEEWVEVPRETGAPNNDR